MTYKMQAILKRFKEEAPKVKLSQKVMNCFDIQDHLSRGIIDLAVQYEVDKYPAYINHRKLASYPLMVVGAPNIADNDLTSNHQQKQLCHISNDANALYMDILKDYLSRKNILLETELELWSIETIKQSVMSYLGVAYLPKFTVDKELEEGLLKPVNAEINGYEMTAVYAYNSQRWMSPALKLFIELLDDMFE